MSVLRLRFVVAVIFCLALIKGKDISSFSNSDIIQQKRIEVNFNVDFDTKIVYGKMKIYFQPMFSGDIIVLDTQQLEILSIIDPNTGETVSYLFDTEHALTNLGTPLKIYYSYTKTTDGEDNMFALVINYKTKNSPSVQWLDPSMTSGKKYPFMFTQCETIACRSLIPCQDTPSMKVLISVSITVKKPLYALNAGIYQSKTETDTHTTFFYDLKIPIPTYLIALAAGAIEQKKLSERSTIYAEAEVVAKAFEEFSETEEFLQIAEAYATPYEWGQMNILVLPPSFPYGGMENPTLTFATPSILAGDKSLANVVAHEIAHSWSGNLVTNANWSNFWLNEGFTVFLERKILEKKYKDDGKDFAKLASMIGVSDWVADVNNFGEGNSFTTLNPYLLGKNPDDAFSSIPYERGYNFIYYLESLLLEVEPTKDLFQQFIKRYFEHFKYQSIQYEQFKEYFVEEVHLYLPDEKAKELLKKIDWEDWINARGYPSIKNDFKNKFSEEIQLIINKFFNEDLDESFVQTFKGWHTNLKLFFLFHITEDPKGINLTDKQYELLVKTLDLKQGYNSEVTFSFLMLALANKKMDIKEQLHSFLGTYGRMKFIRPLYQAYARINKAEAVDLFEKLKNTYHPIAARLVEADLKKIN